MGLVSGLLFQPHILLLRMLRLGPVLLGSWLNGLPSWARCTGKRLEPILGVGGVSLVEMLILYEMWAGERFVLEKAVPTVSET